LQQFHVQNAHKLCWTGHKIKGGKESFESEKQQQELIERYIPPG